MENKNRTPSSFFEAASTLADLCMRIDSEEEINEALIAEFEDAKLSLAESIDRRKHVYKSAELFIKLARERKSELDENIKKLQKIQDRIETKTKQMIEAEPDLPYRDTMGNKLYLMRNSVPSIKLTLDLRTAKSVSNILDEASIFLLEIDEKYIEKVSYSTLNTDAVRADLLKGVDLPWACLQWSTHLRGLK